MAPARLFLDMDGVLADFDRGYRDRFGVASDKATDSVDWEWIRRTPNFYRDLPPMPDMEQLWRGVLAMGLLPTVLTGIPASVPEAHDNKRDWVRRHLGPGVEVIGCRSRDKCLHGRPGDVLVDDWDRYMGLWVDMGGLWVSHLSAENSLEVLQDLRRMGNI